MAVNADPSVVVIGCGIAGIAAAGKLVKAGFRNVRILEATARSGGRIQTGRLGDTVVEIGASYIHGPSEENPLFRLARDRGLLPPEALTAENQAVAMGRKLSSERMNPALEMFIEVLDATSQFVNKKETTWASVGHFMRSEIEQRTAERWTGKDATTKALLRCAISARMKEECSANAACTMNEVDLLGFQTYKHLCGIDCMIPGGYEGLIGRLMSELPTELVSYNRPVRCVHWNNTDKRETAVMVECHDGEAIAADHVVLTVPLGYLKRNHSTLFSPPLPGVKSLSIQTQAFGTCNKIFMEFDSPWWDTGIEVIYFVWEDEEDIVDQVTDISKFWIRKMSIFTVIKSSESHVLCGWISGHESEYMESVPEDDLRSSITELIHRFTGNPQIIPRRILRTQWFHDPWTYGSFFNTAVGFSEKDMENMMAPLPMEGSHSQPLQVLFAGEATHPHYFSTVHGALLTGWREADRLISHYTPRG
ncbi:peroxisomal N(1)-acetyl-spermine/spermidine oxidase-like isoform X2 [Brachionichthys hirsutus]|uniref:peroxisomal N(1)-acetyl-spermine/spermidine oxidase-like isoform X2 n=1 Tax=Brachionichthys hirsutus TaxID=412623 RepID=UPI0036045838